jgi:hypothetical protein
MNCNFCKRTFKSLSSLNYHIKTAKYCLQIQNGTEIKKKEYKCTFCNKNLISKQSLNIHLLSCKSVELKQENLRLLEYIKNIKENIKKEKDIEIKLLQKKCDKKDSIIDKLEFVREKNIEQNKKQDELYLKQEEKIKDLQEQIQKLAMRAIDKTTITNNSIINKLELNNFITPENIEDKIQRKFNDNYIPNGMKDVAKFVYEWILKSEEGNLIYACYDRSRLIFKYKDESGNEVRDPKASQLGKMLKPSLIRKLAEMLKYFTEEFEYLNSRKARDLEYDQKEYNTFKFLKEKALDLGFELTDMNDNNVFCNELAILTT